MKFSPRHRLASIGLILILAFCAAPGGLHAQTEEEPPISPEVEQLMAQMTPEEKVGQLFLITFAGNDVAPGSDIARLIQDYRVGAVVLSPANGNFVNDQRAPEQVAGLANALQTLALTPPITTTESITPTVYTPIPLLIALNQEGDGYPFTSLWNGVTPLPSEMALGATWTPSFAEQVGQIVGQELSAVGVNMLLGPSLDVPERPRPNLYGTLGSRTFIGDPYWAGQFGKSYIRGVHLGADGRVLTVAKHFPGLGGTDRNPDEELPTIQKSLETLRSVELVPFFSVTVANTEDPLATTEALMTSHVRYRGFQGNIRQLTRPISFDAQNLPAILGLPEFAPWRQAGGLLVSDRLGVTSIRKFYDPSLQTFPAKRIAQEAFLAGNDLLYLTQFALTDDWEPQLENIQATILFFREKYDTDPTFRQRVDESVARILQHKLNVVGEFSLDNVTVNIDDIPEKVGHQDAVIARAAQDAATLIYPGIDELSDRLPSPPLSDEQILIITDDRQGQYCEGCPSFYFIEPLALRSLMLQLYGPQATGQISTDQINSLTFGQLKQTLEIEAQEQPEEGSPTPTSTQEGGTTAEEGTVENPEENLVDRLISEADWIIFATLDIDVKDYPNSDALKVFLRERSDSLQGKKLIVLAFNAPYYLDATEVSKLTAYYGLYSKASPFLETSVRLLFQEFQPRGAPPVDVDAIGYQMIEVTRPDPNQVINIEVVTDTQSIPNLQTPTATPQVAPEQTPIPIQLNLEVGDVLMLRTGVIVDRNGRAVPDGTPVEFRLLDTVQGLEARLPTAVTVDGIAIANFNLDRSGTWQITAASDTAQRSVRLMLTIPEKGPVEVGIDRPTATSTATPTPTPTPSHTPTSTATPSSTHTPVPPTLTPTATSIPEPTATPLPPGKTVNALGLFLSVMSLIVIGGLALRLTVVPFQVPLDQRVRRSLAAITTGLTGYVLFGMGLIPLERIPPVTRAVEGWLPYEVLPLTVSILFAILGFALACVPFKRLFE